MLKINKNVIMEKLLKNIGWKEIYPDTIKRLTFFKNAFRKIYDIETISDDELNKCLIYTFGIYGQEHVYNIYSIATAGLNSEENIINSYKSFINVFKEYFGETHPHILFPKNMINLYIEYIYSIHIKGKNITNS
jgi:hypothetical protein